MTLSPMPIFANIGQRVLAWRGVEFGFLRPLEWSPIQHSHYRASVWCC